MPRIFSPVFSSNETRADTNEVRRSESHAARGHQEVKQSMTEQRKAVIKNADMSEDMQQEAVDCASQALSKYNIEKVSTERGRSCIGPLYSVGVWWRLEEAAGEWVLYYCFGILDGDRKGGGSSRG